MGASCGKPQGGQEGGANAEAAAGDGRVSEGLDGHMSCLILNFH